MQPVSQRPRFEPLDPTLQDVYRRATPSQKLAVVARLNATLLELKAAAVRARFPAMPPGEQRALVRHWWLTAHD